MFIFALCSKKWARQSQRTATIKRDERSGPGVTTWCAAASAPSVIENTPDSLSEEYELIFEQAGARARPSEVDEVEEGGNIAERAHKAREQYSTESNGQDKKKPDDHNDVATSHAAKNSGSRSIRPQLKYPYHRKLLSIASHPRITIERSQSTKRSFAL